MLASRRELAVVSSSATPRVVRSPVLPRVLAMLITLPILTFIGILSGIVGGLVVCSLALVGAALWLERACRVPKQPEDDKLDIQ